MCRHGMTSYIGAAWRPKRGATSISTMGAILPSRFVLESIRNPGCRQIYGIIAPYAFRTCQFHLATRPAPERCAASREGRREAFTGETTGHALNRETGSIPRWRSHSVEEKATLSHGE